MCSDSYPIPILSLFFLYHPYIPYFLIQRIFHFIYIFPGQCHTVISNLAITRIIFNPFYNAAVYTAYSEPTMHCIHLVTSGKNHFHEMNGDVGMAQWK